MSDISQLDQFKGCLLGGAIGDALGAAVEFDSLEKIRAKCGENGVTDLMPAYGFIGAITDDTQMTLFTAEGALRGISRGHQKGISSIESVIHHSYLRWLSTQDVAGLIEPNMDGWLINDRRLFKRRSPGNTCLSALTSSEKFGHKAKNNSKGCGSVMRVAPIGLIFDGSAYELGYETSLLTHGHMTAAISAGVLAEMINMLTKGRSLTEAVERAITLSMSKEKFEKSSAETSNALKLALALYQAKCEGGDPVVDIETIGGGWIAEEALAISVYCALSAKNYREGVLMAVNHGGDSDSTGSITGQLLGLVFGLSGIPNEWKDQVELSDVIMEMTDDLLQVVHIDDESDDFFEKYPGW